jgi:drug/metabolite transporter (DMT)-like permease
MEPEDYATLGGLAAMWGASFLFIKVAVGQMSPVFMAFGRTLVGALAVLVILRLSRVPLAQMRRHWRAGLVIAIFNAALPYSLFAFGESFLDSSFAGILNASLPIWTVLMGPLWAEAETLTPARILGLGLGFVGVMVLARPTSGLVTANTIGVLACVAATWSYAFATHYSRRHLQDVPPQLSAFMQCLGAALLLLPLLLISHPTRMPSVAAIGSVLALGVGGTGIAMILAYRLIKRIGASRTSVVTYLVPPSAIFWGWLVLGEKPGPITFLSLALILLGAYLITRRSAVAVPVA